MQTADAANLKRSGTGKSAIGLLVIVIMIVIIGAAMLYVLSNPEVLESVLAVVTIVLVIIAAVVIIFYVAMAVIALPMYAMKGETYQTDMDYDLDDVQAVEDKKDKEEEPKV